MAYATHSSGCSSAHVLAGHARQRPGRARATGRAARGPRGRRNAAASLSGPRHSAPVGHAEPSQRVALAQGHAVLVPQRDRLLQAPRPPAPTGRARPARGRARRAGRPARAAGRCATNRSARRYCVTASRRDASCGGPVARATGVADGGVGVERALGVVGQAGVVVDARTARARRGCGGAPRRRCAGRPPARPPGGRSRGGTAAPRRRRRAGRRRRARRARPRSAPVTACEQVGLDPLADQGRRVEHLTAGGRQPGGPCQHGVARRGGQLVASRRAAPR